MFILLLYNMILSAKKPDVRRTNKLNQQQTMQNNFKKLLKSVKTGVLCSMSTSHIQLNKSYDVFSCYEK